jgi:DNA-binding beta-propeller fold protein YncE
MKRLQGLPLGGRVLVFGFITIGGIAALVGITWLGLNLSLNSTGRLTAVAVSEGVTVAQYVELPGSDAYPSSLAVAPDGTVYAASYASGAVLEISPDTSKVIELANTRDSLISVSGIDIAPDGALILVDRVAPGEGVSGGRIMRWQDGTLSVLAQVVEAEGVVAFNALTVAPDGMIYLTDLNGAVWRFEADGDNGIKFWQVPLPEAGTQPVLTGLTYEPQTDSLLVSDSARNEIYRLSRSTGTAEIIYRFPDVTGFPGLAGLAVLPDGRWLATGLDNKTLLTLDAEGKLLGLAANFRGPGDLAILPDGRVIVANFDSVSLANPLVRPQLPFGLDVVTLPE